MNTTTSQPTVMRAHDPNDDPFGDLSSDMDSKLLPTPAEYGTGAVDSGADSVVKEAGAPTTAPTKETNAEDSTEVTVDESETPEDDDTDKKE